MTAEREVKIMRELVKLRARVVELEAAAQGTVITDNPATWPPYGVKVWAILDGWSAPAAYELRSGKPYEMMGARWWSVPKGNETND